MNNSEKNKNPSRNKHLQAPRADFHDYSAPGYYFITITTHEGTPPLSNIIDPGTELMRTDKMIIPVNTPLGDRVETPISSAIHKAEKDIVRAAINSGSSAIILRDLSFNERFKPSGEYFGLCSEGRLLLICPWPNNIKRRSDTGYEVFHQMNDFAATIASLPATDRLILRIPKHL